MLIPKYWAEGKARKRTQERQVTIRRFGWSDVSHDEAQAMADARAQEALEIVFSGTELDRSEPKVPYNGADGVPIREEIVSEQGSSVITRNSYGARCLNTPNVFFADVDLEDHEPGWMKWLGVLIIVAGSVVTWRVTGDSRIGIPVLIALLILVPWTLGKVSKAVMTSGGGPRKVAMDRIRAFAASHPDWNLHVYETPAGFRLLALHDLFDPSSESVAIAFKQLGTDRQYAWMCLRQQCFRARLSPKPWRIGITTRLRPRPGVWPVAPQHLPARRQWIASYEKRSESFAACRFIEQLGSTAIHADAAAVRDLHDAACNAHSAMPLA